MSRYYLSCWLFSNLDGALASLSEPQARASSSHLQLAHLGSTSYLGSSFKEENYVCNADTGFNSKCVPVWQEDCRKVYEHNEEMQQQLCDTNLDRNYVRIRTMIQPSEILKMWSWDKARRDYDTRFFMDNVPKYTKQGVKRLRMPDDLHAGMQAWLERNRHLTKPEEAQPAFGIHCNTGHDNDDWVVPHSEGNDEEKAHFAKVKAWVLAQLRDWTGEDVNENTAIYGARQYHRGSICGMHVDNTETHAFSAIYQLAQKGMDKNWPLNVVDHDGVEHSVELNPGDVQLYESASVLHGRKTPLEGDEFVNIFFHFRSPQWLPKIEDMMKDYWPKREHYEKAAHKDITSMSHAQPETVQLTELDQCIPTRDRYDPLMVKGGFMNTPKEEDSIPPTPSSSKDAKKSASFLQKSCNADFS